ncbi:MAG: adenosylcobinamide-GDP ribazoletransferase [Solirubrobacteraceae bacterium]|nr:adenosylcobinamide-GDP ribazoletransferase [Solirubrobacteraceae bacterium]
MSDDAAVAATSRFALARRSLLAAITLLTILPVPPRAQRHIGAREVAGAAPWFPVVGAVLGLLIGLAGYGAAAQGSPLLGAALIGILMALVTGALHLDGLADSADALGARGGSSERRLEIMRDSSTGAYGTVVIVAWFLLIASGGATTHPETLPLTLAIVMAVARVGAVAHAAALPSARPSGLGAGFTPTGRALLLTIGSFCLVLVGIYGLASTDLTVFSHPELGALIAIGAFATLSRGLVDGLAVALLGGRTGDTIGAVIALTEATAFAVTALFV